MKKRWKKAFASLRVDGDITMAANRAGLSRSAVAYRVAHHAAWREARDYGLKCKASDRAREHQREINTWTERLERARGDVREARRKLNRELPTLGRSGIEHQVRQIALAEIKLHEYAKQLHHLKSEEGSHGREVSNG